MGINVAQVLRQRALRDPEAIALLDLTAGRESFSFGALDAAARRVGASLLERGICPGDRLALFADKSANFVIIYFGALYAGCTIVPVPTLAAAPEIALRLTHSRCRALISDSPGWPRARQAIELAGVGVSLLDAAALGSASAVPLDAPAERSPEHLAMILYTSGTVGAARGVQITHASLVIHTASLVHHPLRLGAEDRVLAALPLSHSFGLRMALLAPFHAGATVVLMGRFEASAALGLIAHEGITFLPAVPTMYAAFAAAPEGPTPSSLRWCLSAGAPLPEGVRDRAEARLGAQIRQGYGMTEATFSTIDAPPSERLPGSVGAPVWGVEVRIVDELGATLGPGALGEILLRGNNVMAGYLDDPEASAEVMRGGWVHSGDLGRLDAEGRLQVVDRLKDLIIRSGHSVYPSEVEGVLASLPEVADVAIVGRPHEARGEEIVAFLVLRQGARLGLRELDAHARAQLSPVKVPREVVFLDALPIGPSRKVLKRELRSGIVEGRFLPLPIPREG